MNRMAKMVLVAALTAGCSALVFANGQKEGTSQGGSSSSAASASSGYTFYMVTHACPSGPFWGPLYNGAKIAANELGVSLYIIKLTSAQCGSIPSEVSNVETAISANPNGIIVTVPSATAFSSALQQAQSQGIPVVAINTVPKNNNFAQNPYLAYVGQDNYQAGVGAGKEAAKLFNLQSGDQVAVVDQEPYNISLTARENGIAAGLKSVGIKPVDVNTNDNPSSGATIIAAFVTHNPNVKALMTLGPVGTTQVVTALQQDGEVGKIDVSAFDLDTATVHYIENGSVGFTVDQQPFLQGAYGVIELYLKNKFGAAPENFPTGPAYLTSSNVKKLAKYVKATGY